MSRGKSYQREPELPIPRNVKRKENASANSLETKKESFDDLPDTTNEAIRTIKKCISPSMTVTSTNSRCQRETHRNSFTRRTWQRWIELAESYRLMPELARKSLKGLHINKEKNYQARVDDKAESEMMVQHISIFRLNSMSVQTL